MPENKGTPGEATCSPTPERNTQTPLGAYFDRHNRRTTRITRVQCDPGNMQYIDQDDRHPTNTHWGNGPGSGKDLQGPCVEQIRDPKESDQRQGTPVRHTIHEGLVQTSRESGESLDSVPSTERWADGESEPRGRAIP